MQVNDRVTYAKTRETQDIQPDRRNAHGTIIELDTIDNHLCAKVEWDWLKGAGWWVRCCHLKKIDQENIK